MAFHATLPQSVGSWDAVLPVERMQKKSPLNLLRWLRYLNPRFPGDEDSCGSRKGWAFE